MAKRNQYNRTTFPITFTDIKAQRVSASVGVKGTINQGDSGSFFINAGGNFTLPTNTNGLVILPNGNPTASVDFTAFKNGQMLTLAVLGGSTQTVQLSGAVSASTTGICGLKAAEEFTDLVGRVNTPTNTGLLEARTVYNFMCIKTGSITSADGVKANMICMFSRSGQAMTG